MGDCIFCKIMAGESPVSAFYEDELVLGLMDINPVNMGHAMIIPKAHAAHLADLDEETGKHLWMIAQRTAAAIRESGVRCEGINLFLADGEAAFQDVFHVHLHVFPRYKGDPFKIDADWSKQPPRDELDQVARQIRRAYNRLWMGED
jgi:diadenosine tetraphosphate (Ap4A) HIT family hydrolase